MNPNVLFVRIFDDLEARSQSPDLYDVLQCARIIRQLLVDREPVLSVANRHLRLQIRFEVAKSEMRDDAPKPVIHIVADGLDPETSLVQRERINCNRDGFLRQVCITVHEQRYTVRDVIKYLSNTAGGVHYETLPDEEQKIMRGLDQTLKLGGQDAVFRQLAPIIRITLRALRPLRNKLYAQLESGG